MSRLALYLLGPPRLELDGEPVHITRQKVMALLAYLAVTGQSHSRDTLATLLWPEYAQSRARANLRHTLWVLNRTLGSEGLTADRDTAGLNPDPGLWLDVREFRQKLAACETHGHPAMEACPDCLAVLEEAVALYRDDFMAGFTLRDSAPFDEWQLFQTEGLRDELAGALERLVRCHSTQGEYEPAIGYARRWLALDPLHEPTHRHLMQLYAQAGRRTTALRQYRACMRVLEEELGLPPSAETTALYERIWAERARPRESEVVAPAVPSSTVPHVPAFLAEEEAPRAVERPVFVARERELAQLDGYLEVALGGQGQVVLVTGGPGRGKTALMREFARRAMEAHPDLLVAGGNSNAHSGVGDAYLPFREVLGMLTGDVEGRWVAGTISREHARRLWAAFPLALQALVDYGPSLIPTILSDPALLSRATAVAPEGAGWLPELRALSAQERAGPGDLEQSAIFHQFTNVLRTLAETHPLLLMLDDLQWADSTSVGLLFHLGRRLEGGRILIACAYRPEEVALEREGERHPLEKVLAEFKRSFGDVWVDLRRADETEGRRFVDAFLDTEPNRLQQGFRSALFQNTGGHPLFTVEMLRAMQDRGEMVQDAEGRWVEGPSLDWERLPARVEAVIAERVGWLDADLQDVLAVASVEGERFTAQVVAQVQDTPEREVLRALSRELGARHRLVREGEEVQVDGRFLSRYQFAHALFQEYLYRGLSGGERRLLHGEIAVALEELYRDKADEIVAQLAHHYVEGGRTEKAIGYSLRAGDQARLAYAHYEAIGAYERALALLKEQGDYERAARTLMQLGLTHHTAFDFRAARQAYEEGFALWQRAGEAAPTAEMDPAPHPLRQAWIDPSTLDPGLSVDFGSIPIIHQLFSGLVGPTPDLGVVPDVAASWEVLDGGRRYVFHLRDDVHWSDGVPLTAGDFEYAWKRVLDPATASPAASLLHDVQGARAFHQSLVSEADGVGVRAIDDSTLSVELDRPVGYLLHLLAHTTSFPVPRHVVARWGAIWTDVDKIVTNGPFTLAEWRPGQELALARNPRYHGRFGGNLERVELSLFPEGSYAAGFELYEAGLLDVYKLDVDAREKTDRIRRQHGAEYVSLPVAATRYVAFDVRRAPFDDARVRRAFAYAVDRETLAGVTLGGYYSPASGGFVPPGMPTHSPGIGLPYSPERARDLLAEAGYPGGRGFPIVDFVTPSRYHAMGEHLHTQWQENLGVELHWRERGWTEFYGPVDSDPPHLFLAGWVADYPDPDAFLRVVVQGNTAWRPERYLALVDEARHATDQRETMRVYAEVERMLAEEVPLLPLAYARSHYLYKPWVRRYPRSVIEGHFWKDVVIEPH